MDHLLTKIPDRGQAIQMGDKAPLFNHHISNPMP